MMTKNKKDNSKLRGFSLFMEKFWLALAIVSLIAVIYILYTEGGFTKENSKYFIFPFLAALMYGFRTVARKRMEKDED